ncbi:leucine--tRNA ligase [Candidatus Gracilibacteria bacterium]|nr:leucine--tRNA ligase [Candidatus Gracilibacteria bacterium]
MEENTTFNHLEIEKKWQDFWEKNKTFKTEIDKNKEKFYILDMFPYPSGAGLHVGHPEGYTASDILARYKRLKGFNVLHPMGWDAFGLPAENYAIKTGTHPSITTQQNIENFTKQIKSIGFSYDWDREINTTDEDYYKWTQWIFLKLFEKGLAYETKMPINFCPSCKTGLANEEVVEGKCDRCNSVVERKNLRQWMLKITEYAPQLLEDLDTLPGWSDSLKAMQRNWIGKSEGCEFEMLKDGDGFKKISVYTTRIDTVFGMTYAVLAPDHKDVKKFITDEKREECEKYIEQSSKKSDLDRTELAKEKTGVFTGSYVVNPFNGEKVPLWIGDYVLGSYGTGAVMAVPAHDERDFEFAKKYGLEIVNSIGYEKININNCVLDEGVASKVYAETKIINNKNIYIIIGEPTIQDGILINSGEFTGLTSKEAREKISKFAEENNFGTKKINFKLRDWVFSRQRYRGEPIPIVHCDDCGMVAEKEENLPLTLPKVEKYEPSGTGESPLANIEEWVNCKCPKCGKPAKRETNTMPQWAGSSWYYLRYMDPKNSEKFVGEDAEKYWGQVDVYVGGAEHAVLHLLYARFWHKVLFDLGLVSHKEPFKELRNQGLVMALDGEKMSKSKGNVVNPDDVIQEFGADTLRLYEMFMGPFDQNVAWDTKGIKGVKRFLDKVWNLRKKVDKDFENSDEVLKNLHQTIKKVGEKIEKFEFNTAISDMMVLANLLQKQEKISRGVFYNFLKILNPFAPHLTEELNEILWGQEILAYQKFPEYSEKWLTDNEKIFPIQVNGKVRAQLKADKDISKDDAIKEAKKLVEKYLEGKEIKKEIFVPGKIIGFVV